MVEAVDISEIIDNNKTVTHYEIKAISIISIFFPVYLAYIIIQTRYSLRTSGYDSTLKLVLQLKNDYAELNRLQAWEASELHELLKDAEPDGINSDEIDKITELLSEGLVHGIQRLIDKRRHKQSGSDHIKVSVAMYIEDEGYLRVKYSFDGSTRNCIKSPNTTHKERFKLAGNHNTFAVGAYRSPMPLIYSDVEKSHSDPTCYFTFLDDSQNESIRSIAGFRVPGLSHVFEDNGERSVKSRSVIVIHTNCVGLLSILDQTLMEQIQRCIGQKMYFYSWLLGREISVESN